MKKALILSGIYWNETWQRHQQFAEYLAAMGYKVYFVEHIISSVLTAEKIKGIVKKAEAINITKENPRHKNIELCSVGYLTPQKGLFFLWNKLKNKKLVEEIGSDFDVVINYLPINTTRNLLEQIHCRTLVYDCVRNFTGWSGCQYPADIAHEELTLCEKANMIFTDSIFLTDKIKGLGYGQKVEQFFPVINESWIKGVVKNKEINEIKKVAYFGTFSKTHNNVEVYQALANAGIEIHIWGSVPSDLEFSYIDHGFKNNLEELSREITTICDAIVIAYSGNMDGVIPAKLCQAMGSKLPVFISDFYDSRKLAEYVFVFVGEDDLIHKIKSFDVNEYLPKYEAIVRFLEGKNEGAQYARFESVLSKKEQT